MYICIFKVIKSKMPVIFPTHFVDIIYLYIC